MTDTQDKARSLTKNTDAIGKNIPYFKLKRSMFLLCFYSNQNKKTADFMEKACDFCR